MQSRGVEAARRRASRRLSRMSAERIDAQTSAFRPDVAQSHLFRNRLRTDGVKPFRTCETFHTDGVKHIWGQKGFTPSV